MTEEQLNPSPDDQGRRAERAGRTKRRASARVRRNRRIAAAGLAVVVLLGGGFVYWAVTAASNGDANVPTIASTSTPTTTPTPTETGTATPAPTQEQTPTAEPTPTETQPPAAALNTSDPNSITVLVNKQTPLTPADYAPADLVAMSDIGVPSANGHSLRAEAATAVQTMFAAASAEAGLTLDMTSGYRGYGLQTELYTGYVADLGQEAADLTSARPGYSEHQTGLAADISSQGEGCVLEQCFSTTAGGQWLAANAHRFGFILRYPDGGTATTGYEFEPWHYRYVGTETSAAMHAAGITTYEQFLGAPAAPGY
ncbi:D-alanyl-D-alanine carboxypeptidase family protein [Pseudoclavibacter helvolus]|uniref:M15 family metallopeptidase n=1 Tax=Pseudoclavibacter helvolus TaxID=255205 RepID=UPI003C777F06